MGTRFFHFFSLIWLNVKKHIRSRFDYGPKDKIGKKLHIFEWIKKIRMELLKSQKNEVKNRKSAK